MTGNKKPWFVPEAIPYIESILKPDMKVFEWGSGYSTKWFADRVRHIISIEYQLKWYRITSKLLKKQNNATILLIDDNRWEKYVKAISGHPDETFDIVIIDGRRRVECAKEAIPKIKSGGYLIFDDIERVDYIEVLPLFCSWPNIKFVSDLEFKDGSRKTTGVYIKP